MLAVYVNSRYEDEADTPTGIIEKGLILKLGNRECTITIRNDFGDEWELREYIDKIERFTAIRVPERYYLW